jgi:hypothetical protein
VLPSFFFTNTTGDDQGLAPIILHARQWLYQLPLSSLLEIAEVAASLELLYLY